MSNPNKELSKVGLDDKTFSDLQNEFKKVMERFVDDKNLDKFRVEYEKLYNSYVKSFENQKRLMHKCRE
ncbi:hypothetical protein A3Q56_06096 [Intoshia linei]|uniref:Uncharacterized protein n=1 Tax=Intoshia linei TaxID=1819745 RepID=A0A177AXE5_9BILA|nr:hypothetical protein A3Q56_06096 [Intoshia linei]